MSAWYKAWGAAWGSSWGVLENIIAPPAGGGVSLKPKLKTRPAFRPQPLPDFALSDLEDEEALILCRAI